MTIKAIATRPRSFTEMPDGELAAALEPLQLYSNSYIHPRLEAIMGAQMKRMAEREGHVKRHPLVNEKTELLERFKALGQKLGRKGYPPKDGIQAWVRKAKGKLIFADILRSEDVTKHEKVIQDCWRAGWHATGISRGLRFDLKAVTAAILKLEDG